MWCTVLLTSMSIFNCFRLFVRLFIRSFVCLFSVILFEAFSSFVCQHYVSIYRKFPFIPFKSGIYLLVFVWKGVGWICVSVFKCLLYILSTIQHKFNLLFLFWICFRLSTLPLTQLKLLFSFFILHAPFTPNSTSIFLWLNNRSPRCYSTSSILRVMNWFNKITRSTNCNDCLYSMKVTFAMYHQKCLVVSMARQAQGRMKADISSTLMCWNTTFPCAKFLIISSVFCKESAIKHIPLPETNLSRKQQWWMQLISFNSMTSFTAMPNSWLGIKLRQHTERVNWVNVIASDNICGLLPEYLLICGLSIDFIKSFKNISLFQF